MVSETAPDITNYDKECSIYVTRMVSYTVTDQVGTTERKNNAKLKHNSIFLDRNELSSMSPSRASSWESSLVYQCRQEELKQLFLCPGDYIFTELEYIKFSSFVQMR